MPATVHVSPSARTSLRAIIVIAAVVALLVPITISVAHGASRLNYANYEHSEPLSAGMKNLSLALDTSAEVVIKTSDVGEPTVTLAGTAPRDKTPKLDVRETGDSSEVSVDGQHNFENARVEVALPAQLAKGLKLDLAGGFGTLNITGDYKEIIAKTDGGSVDVDATADRLQTSTDYGETSLTGTFGTIESKTKVGTIDGTDLRVRDHVDAVTSAGSIDLDLSNDMVPVAGIVAKTDTGTIDLSLPRLKLAQENMAAEATASKSGDEKSGDEKSGDAKDLFYRINANSQQGSVDLAQELKKYDASKSAADAKGKTVIPVSVSADTGAITIEQN